MLNVERRVQREVAPRLLGNAHAGQTTIDEADPRGCGQLDRAQRADGVVGVPAVERQGNEQVGERERLPNGFLEDRLGPDGTRELGEQRAMHRARASAAHLVPIVARQLELGPHRHAKLRQRHEVVEARLAADLLAEKPAHLIEGRLLREEREERIALTGTALPQRLEPGDEPIRVGRRARCLGGDSGALLIHERRLERTQLRLVPGCRLVRKGRAKPPLRIAREAQVELLDATHTTRL